MARREDERKQYVVALAILERCCRNTAAEKDACSSIPIT